MHCDPCEVSPPLDAGQPFGLDLFSQVKKKSIYICNGFSTLTEISLSRLSAA